MMGLRAEYEVSENFYIGGTALRLAERPFTEKVNIGDDPIKNKIWTNCHSTVLMLRQT